MRLPVALDSSKRTCFIALPNVAIRALFGQQRPAGVVALKMRWGGKTAFVGFAGHMSSRAVVEVPTAFAQTIGLAEDVQAAGGIPLFVVLNKVDYAPKVQSITLDPVSEDDWEIIERNAGFLENSLLDQISAVYTGLIFPVWIEGRMLVRLKATSKNSNVCELLARDSEVIIAPRVRKKNRSEQKKALPKPDIVDNVGEKRNILELKVLPCEDEQYSGPAIRDGWKSNTQAFMHPKTLERLADGNSKEKSNKNNNDEESSDDENNNNNNNNTRSTTTNGNTWGGRYRPLLGSIITFSDDDDIEGEVDESKRKDFMEENDDAIVLFFPNESVPEDYVCIPWATRIKCNLEIFKRVKVATRISTPPKKASNKVEIFLRPVHFELEKNLDTDDSEIKEKGEEKKQDNGKENKNELPTLDQSTDTSAILLAAKLSNTYNFDENIVIDAFWASVNAMEDKQKLFREDNEEYTYGGGLILSHGSIIVLKLKSGFAPQAFEIGLMIKSAQDNVNLQSAWKDTLESAGGARIGNATIPNAGLLNENEVEKKREWRIICSKEATKGNALIVPNVYLGSPATVPVPMEALCDEFYDGVPPAFIGARNETLHKAWLQLASRIVPEAIRIRTVLGTPPPGHLLITGGNATGKSTFVSALAWKFRHDRSCLARTITVECRSLVGKKTPDVRKALKKALDDGMRMEPAVIIFDDIDALMPVSEGGEPENVQAARLAEDLSDMLIETSRVMERKMYEAEKNNQGGDNIHSGGIAIVATAKRKGALHPSLQRCGIIDTALAMDPPDAQGRGDIIDALLDKVLVENGYETSNDSISENNNRNNSNNTPDVDEDIYGGNDNSGIDSLGLGGLTEGYMPGDLQLLVKRARLISSLERVKENSRKIESSNNYSALDYLTKGSVLPQQEHFDEAMEEYKPAALKSVKLFTSDVEWSDVGGLDKVRHTLKDTLQLPTLFAPLFSRAPIKLPSGVCLFGPPGCGKTLLAGAVANECGLNFISVKGPEILNKYIGGSEENVRNLFARAAAAAPSILFFDEFDSVAPRRGADSTGVTDRVVNQLLTFLDGVEDRTGVYVMAATSRPDMIDPALLRPGRLDKSLYCGFPDEKERISIFETVATKMGLSKDVFQVFPQLALEYSTFTGADIQAALYTAQLSSIHESTPSMEELKKLEAEGKKPPSATENVVTPQQVIDACAAARPSVSIQDRRMYTKIYKKYLADRGQDEESPVGDDAGDNDDDSFGYDVKKQRTALA